MAYITKYFEVEQQYEDRYGEKTVVLKETGMFYEMYEKDSSKKLSKIDKILNLAILQSRDLSFRRSGIPHIAKEKYVKMLVDEEYVVIIIDHNWNEEKIYLQG